MANKKKKKNGRNSNESRETRSESDAEMKTAREFEKKGRKRTGSAGKA